MPSPSLSFNYCTTSSIPSIASKCLRNIMLNIHIMCIVSVDLSFVPSYAPKATKPSAPTLSPKFCSPFRTFADLSPDFFQILSCVGPSLHSDPILLTKILRLGRAFFKEHSSCLGRGAQTEFPSRDIVSPCTECCGFESHTGQLRWALNL